MAALPEHLESQRRNVLSKGEVNYNTSTVTSANAYRTLGVDNSWNEERWKQEFQVVVNWIKDKDMEFDLIHTDPAIVNALRRILIAEVPTMAIEHVFFVNNTSIIADEVLAHRLGMVPLNIDPDKFEYKSGEEMANEKNTVVLKLQVHCKRISKEAMQNEKVLSSAFQWLPAGSDMPDETSCRFASSQEGMLESPAGPLHDDILLAKMRSGQCIDLEAHCVKGVGAEHAKWSPVATAWYRLHPEVVIPKGKSIKGKDACMLAVLCPGLFELVKDKKGEDEAKVTAARGNEVHLEKLRHLVSQEGWADRVKLHKKKEHFIFTVQSAAMQEPDVLFCRALDHLSEKCDMLLARI